MKNSNKEIGNAFCGDISLLEDIDNCNDHLNQTLLLSDWNQNCQNKSKCDFNLGKSSYYLNLGKNSREACQANYT